MATRQADANAYVKRAQAIGWRTEDGEGGVTKVYNPDGLMVPIHKTYGSAASLRNLEAHLKRIGLHQTEEEMLNAKFSNGQDRTARGRVAAAKKAKELEALAQANNVAKAAGPYLVDAEDVGIVWFAEKHPAPWMRWVNITPEIAKYLLDHHNTTNRAIRDSQVDHYMAIIRTNQWHLTHQGIAMDSDAVLQDGQHRLKAIELLGDDDLPDLKLPFAFFVGMDPANFKAIDEGLLRTAAQLFGRAEEKNGSALQTGVRLVIAYRSQDPRRQMRLRFPNQAILDTFNEDADLYRDSAQVGSAYARKVALAPGVLTAGNYLLRKANGVDNQFVTAFFEGLSTGLRAGSRMILDDDDPRRILRDTMEKNKTANRRPSERATTRRRITGIDQLALLILTWNNVVNDYRPRVIKYTENSDLPRIIVCRDSGPNASTCPRALLGEIDTHEDEEDGAAA